MVQVLDDIISRGASASNIRIVTVVCAPAALQKLSEGYPGMGPLGCEGARFYEWRSLQLSVVLRACRPPKTSTGLPRYVPAVVKEPNFVIEVSAAIRDNRSPAVVCMHVVISFVTN